MEKQIELLINEFGEIPDNNWEQERSAAESRLGDRVNSYPGVPPLTWKVVAKNIGRGADWWVLSLCFIGAGIVVPKMHKEIREGIDEWQRIYKELQRFFDWILEGKKPLYPDEYLFLKAVDSLASSVDNMEFKGIVRMPENDPSLQGIEGLIFSFANKNKVIQVAVSRIGEVLWQNQLLVPQLPKLLSSPYESCVPVFVEKFKTLLQFTIGAFLILVLTLKGALELGQTLQLVKETSEATLWNHIFGIKVFAYTAAALGISAGIELGYMLFTDGPDEAISPVMLCVASAAFYTLSQNPNGGWILGVYSLSLLVLIYCLKKYKDWGIDKKP